MRSGWPLRSWPLLPRRSGVKSGLRTLVLSGFVRVGAGRMDGCTWPDFLARAPHQARSGSRSTRAPRSPLLPGLKCLTWPRPRPPQAQVGGGRAHGQLASNCPCCQLRSALPQGHSPQNNSSTTYLGQFRRLFSSWGQKVQLVQMCYFIYTVIYCVHCTVASGL